jgi:copper chaperone NosL
MRISRRALLGSAAAFTLAGCGGEAAATEEIHYGREACTKCGMIISDPLFAAEIRGGPDNDLKKFDDAGCAVTWLETQSWRTDKTTQFWVMDGGSGQSWLTAAEAFYLPGAMSPMNYGYSAHREKTDRMVDFATMKSAALSRG